MLNVSAWTPAACNSPLRWILVWHLGREKKVIDWLIWLIVNLSCCGWGWSSLINWWCLSLARDGEAWGKSAVIDWWCLLSILLILLYITDWYDCVMLCRTSFEIWFCFSCQHLSTIWGLKYVGRGFYFLRYPPKFILSFNVLGSIPQIVGKIGMSWLHV